MSTLRFPMFIDLTGKPVLVVGGGKIALRRANVLLDFGARVTIVSPACEAVPEGAAYVKREYRSQDLAGAFLAVAATDSREINRQVGLDARALGIPVTVADRQEECTFFFPAVCRGQELIAGVVSDGSDHRKTARAARAIRSVLEELT